MASNNKYDRQLRLWGAAGQESLALSHAVLIGCCGTSGTETLKNLILPGIGGFTCIDTETYPLPQSSTPPLIPSSNFFIPPSTPSTPSSPLCSVVYSNLQELNPDVDGGYLVPEVSLQEFISNDVPEASTTETSLATYLKQSDRVPYPLTATPSSSGAKGTVLLVGSDLSSDEALKLSHTASRLQLPLLLVRTYGMIGTLRVQSATGEFTVVEPRAEGVKWDLRMRETVESPATFSELAQYAEGMVGQMPMMDQQQHGHVPYVVICMEALKRWREGHGGNIPTSFAEKDEFRAAIKAMSKDFGLEMNFQEGVREAYTAYTKTAGITDAVKDLMDRADVKTLTKESTQFCILLNALTEFTSTHAGMPPLNGSIPDMTSDSSNYIKLQALYFDRSKRELADFTALVQARLSKLGLPTEYIPPPSIATFAKNVPYLTVVSSKPYHEEVTGALSEEDRETMQGLLWDPHEEMVHTPMLWWCGVKAAEEYQRAKGSWPAPGAEGEVAATMDGVMKRYGLTQEEGTVFDTAKLTAVAGEITRYENAENHTVGSVVGGVAGQEGVKVITGIYVPIDNTYIFNGIAGVAGVVKG